MFCNIFGGLEKNKLCCEFYTIIQNRQNETMKSDIKFTLLLNLRG